MAGGPRKEELPLGKTEGAFLGMGMENSSYSLPLNKTHGSFSFSISQTNMLGARESYTCQAASGWVEICPVEH